MDQYGRPSLGIFSDMAYSEFTPRMLEVLKKWGYSKKDFPNENDEEKDHKDVEPTKDLAASITENPSTSTKSPQEPTENL